jgi:uncharacterized membrane protein
MATRDAALRERFLVPGLLAASTVLLIGYTRRLRRPRIAKERPDMPSLSQGRGAHLERTVTIARPRNEVYRAWRDLENLPRFIPAVQSITVSSPTRSHWQVRGPAGQHLSWDADVVAERDGELIAWRSVPGSSLDIAGSVHFKDAPGDRGTELKVILAASPRRRVAGLLAKLAAAGDAQLREGLRTFKQIMETGEAATVEGQPSGRAERSRWRQAS